MSGSHANCRFSGRAFVARFGTARECWVALDALFGLDVSLHTVEGWQDRDRVPSSVLAVVVARLPGFSIQDLVVCDARPGN